MLLYSILLKQTLLSGCDRVPLKRYCVYVCPNQTMFCHSHCHTCTLCTILYQTFQPKNKLLLITRLANYYTDDKG